MTPYPQEPLPPSLSLQICEPLTADTAASLIASCGATDSWLRSRDLKNRMLLGRVLLETQRREFWRSWGYASWMSFLDHGFPEMSGGLDGRTAYDAMSMAKSKVLGELAPADLEAIPTLAHARHLVRQERTREVTAAEVREAALIPARDLVKLTGAEKGAVARLWTADAEKAAQLQRIIEKLATAAAEPLKWLADLLDSETTHAYAGGTVNLVDFLLGVMVSDAAAEIRAAFDHMVEELGPERVAVLAKYGWRCVGCGGMLPLQAHHVVFRSHGGHDGEQEPRCQSCHSKVHGR